MKEYSAIEANKCFREILNKLANDRVGDFTTDTTYNFRNSKVTSRFFARLSELDNSLKDYTLVKREDYDKKYYYQ